MTPGKLASEMEKPRAAAKQRELFGLAFVAIHGLSPPRVLGGSQEWLDWHDLHNPFLKMLDAGAFESAAMTLLPASATNLSLFSYGRGWACSFNDQAQTVGDRGAKKEMARLIKKYPAWNELRSEPLISYEKAISEHWLEFISRGAQTAGLAVAAVAVRSLKPSLAGLI